MTAALTDAQAWTLFPEFRRWFNKLDLAERLGHRCGPCGVAPERGGWYVVRPIYNLSGMGAGAKKVYIDAGDRRSTPPGHFWCEWFDGDQISVTYTWKQGWVTSDSWLGERSEEHLSKFKSWSRVFFDPELPKFFDELAPAGLVNVEFIGESIIEVHLRPSPDPKSGTKLIPVWEGEDVPEDMIPSYDDADGFVHPARLGFVVR